VGITVVESKSIYAYPFKVIHRGPVLFCCSGLSALWREVRLRRLLLKKYLTMIHLNHVSAKLIRQFSLFSTLDYLH
jgi:hypothetical protein